MKFVNTPTLRWLWEISKGHRTQAIINVGVGIFSVALDFSFIWATKRAIDVATGRVDDSLFVSSLLLIAIMASNILLNFSRRWIAAILGVMAQNQMQLHIFQRLMGSTWDGLEAHHSGDVLNRLELDVQDVTNVITETIPSLATVLVRLVGAFTFLYTWDPKLAFIMILIAPCFILLSKVYVRKMRAITREVRKTDSKIQSLLQESIQHRVVLKTLEQSSTMTERLANLQSHLRSQIRHKTLFSSFSTLIFNAGFGTGYLVTFLWGANRLMEGTITYGTMIAFIQLVGQIQGPFREITRFIPTIISSLTASERLMELDAAPQEEQGEPVLFPNGASLRFTDVSFAYSKGKRKVLDRLSFTFPIGSTTAILGETGAGKTTLIRLILSLLKPQEGTVEIYDNERSMLVSPLTRCNLVYVPQGNTLFSGSIRDNLLLGNPSATEEEMKEALKTACAEFVFQMPSGMDTLCGELGAGLSEGQAQRISIARALLRKGNILLLDEATSALDINTEERLLRQINNHGNRQQTVICITHRPAVVEYCTQTLTLKRTT